MPSEIAARVPAPRLFKMYIVGNFVCEVRLNVLHYARYKHRFSFSLWIFKGYGVDVKVEK